MNAFTARLCLCICLTVTCAAPEACAQLSGMYQSAPDAVAVYQYHTNNLHAVLLPVNLTVSFFQADVAPALSATIVKPIIGAFPDGTPLFPIADEFPMRVTGTADNSQTYHGNLLGSQYLFDWTVRPGSGSELLLDGRVYWAGGRYELTTISGARLLPSIAGDYNQDGAANAADYAIWRKNLETTSALANDPIGDVIGQPHYDQWRANFGQSTAGGTAGGTVPEPATTGLLLNGLSIIVAWRPSWRWSRSTTKRGGAGPSRQAPNRRTGSRSAQG